MHRWLLAGLFVCCVGLDAAADGQASPLAHFQAMVNQADSYSAAYRQYQALQSSLANPRADEGNPTQDIFPGVSPTQWQTMGNTLRQRAIAESSAFDAALLLNLKRFKQSPFPEHCRIDPQWLAVATSSVLSQEQSELFGQLMALRQICNQKQSFHPIYYALEMKHLVEAYDHIGQPELAADTLIKGFSKLDKLQDKDRRAILFLLSHRDLSPLLAETSLRLVAQFEPEELRIMTLARMQYQLPYRERWAELVEIAGVPEHYSEAWWRLAYRVALKGDVYLVEPALMQMLSEADLNEPQRNKLNEILAIGYLIANDPQASLAAYDRISSNSGDTSETMLFRLLKYDKSAVYVQYVRQRINTETRPIHIADLLFNYAYNYIQAGQIELGVDMCQQGLNILFKSNYQAIDYVGGKMVDILLYNGLIEQAELINERLNTETITTAEGESYSPSLRRESEFAVAYARAGDFYRAQRFLLSAAKWGSDNADNANTLIDIYADAGEFALAERAAAWVNFDPEYQVAAWLHVAKGYLKHGDLEKAKARLNHALSLVNLIDYDLNIPFDDIAQGYAAIKELPPELLALAKNRKTDSSLADIAKVYAEAGLNNLALQVIAQIRDLDDQLATLSGLRYHKDTQLSLDDSGKAQLAKIIQQQFPLKAFWQQVRQ
ncbi:hypothetical protein [Pseudaeromonas paramecii]|uniref:Tetratricopeptide repeat protein n=1 Tax=Pseudaeromonas paramecii TaxID=2138166 RepID=A0ABP8QI95_9GAMM